MKLKNQSGITLILTLVILSMVTLIAVSLASIVIVQLRLVSDLSNSVAAAYASISGIEWRLYNIRKGAGVPAPTMSNGATITTTVTGALPALNIKSLGTFGETRRQFEVNF